MRNTCCTKCDKYYRCHHPKIKSIRILFFRFRPICKLLRPYKETVLKNGDVIEDNKCKYQVKWPRPKSFPKGGSGLK